MKVGRTIAAVVIAALGTLRGIGVDTIDLTCLGFFVLATGIYFLDEFQEFSFGKDGFSFKKRAQEALETLGVGGKPEKSNTMVEMPPALRELGERMDDPNREQFGGSPIANGKRLTATVRPYPSVKEWFVVRLVVESLDSTHPLTGRVSFFLHPTFKQPKVSVVASNGQAILETVAWGAFTVGAVSEVDGTMLELDLSTLPNAPVSFVGR